jgi:asparagine synthase (glutamine-hydrolysing)
MCGLAGFLAPGGFDPDAAGVIVDRMSDAIAHRGPDDSGRWLDADAGVALGHRRLSILDLSAGGHQPMLSDSGRFVLAFNGETYNHLELRQKLEPRRWRGHSDTETLLAGVEKWGFERTLQQCTGMFAIALYDREAKVLSLARDRMGEKPLYYGWQGGSFRFARLAW